MHQHLYQKLHLFTTLPILLFYLLSITKQINLVQVENCETQLLTLYNNFNMAKQLSNQSFTINFNKAFINQPIFAIGNAGYSGSSLSNQSQEHELFEISSQLDKNYTALKITVLLSKITSIQLLLVNYLVVDNKIVGPNLFTIYQNDSIQLKNNSQNISKNNDQWIITSYEIKTTKLFNLQPITSCFINGLQIKSYGQFKIQSWCNYGNGTGTLQFVVGIYGNITLDQISFAIIAVDISIILNSNEYQVFTGTINETSWDNRSVLEVQRGTTNISILSTSDILHSNFVYFFSGCGGNNSFFQFNFSSSRTENDIIMQNFVNNTYILYKYLIFGKTPSTNKPNCMNKTYCQICQNCPDCPPCIKQTSSINEVIVCNPPCNTCSATSTTCTSCIKGYYLYQQNCIKQNITSSQNSNSSKNHLLINMIPVVVAIILFVFGIVICIFCTKKRFVRSSRISNFQMQNYQTYPSIQI